MRQTLQYRDDSSLNRAQGIIGIVRMIAKVERTIKESDSHLTKRQLLNKLPNVSSYQLGLVLELFEQQNKIIYDKDNKIVWTAADNPTILKLLKESELVS
ncbi:MAG: hypothetical protein ACRD5B_14100 [Nitrososphaeraceae archaeon]